MAGKRKKINSFPTLRSMRHWFRAFLWNLVFVGSLQAQTDSVHSTSAAIADTGKILPDVQVHAYEQYGPLLTLPAAVSIVNASDLNQYNNTSILQAVNTIPGVRMEERSPGSYRFGIRGSALESPFGVRNVKVYYNGIPYTDAGGNTYLNQLGFYNIQSLEIIKGPGSSLYGSGTGGVLLINSMPAQWQPGATVNYTGGNYGLSNTEAEVRFGDCTHNVVRYQHLSGDGYRQQSAMQNDVISWDGVLKHNTKSELSVHFLYGDLHYNTPGGLTLAEYNANPAQARPGTAAAPGAAQAKAAIYQKTFLTGFTYKTQFAQHWSSATTLYGDYSQQLNPNIRNYSRTSEPNFGGRTSFTYQISKGRSVFLWVTGGEVQQQLADNRTYNNVSGAPQTLQADQELNNRQAMGFTQFTWRTGHWVVTGGASINSLSVGLNTLSGTTPGMQDKTYSSQVAPRLAILNRLTNNISVYATVEKGFSPPTITELAPTGSQVNFDLQPEQGWNYEAGLRSYAINQQLSFDINIFYFRLRNTIVQRRDSSGGDYYVNSGSTTQAGVEAYLKYKLHLKNAINTFFWLGYSGYSFHYNKFVQVSNDYSGKALPGTPGNTISAGVSATLAFCIYADVNYYFCDRIALNDANTAYAAPDHLLGSRVGYKKTMRKYAFDIFAGANNLLNQKYSLGNDINAINGRYYNAAPLLNYYAGISLSYLK